MFTIFKQGFYTNSRCDSSATSNLVVVIVSCKSVDYPFTWCRVRVIVYHLRISIEICFFLENPYSFAGKWVFRLEFKYINKEQSLKFMKLDIWQESLASQIFCKLLFKEGDTTPYILHL